MIMHARPLTFGTYLSDSHPPGLGPVDPTSHSASHSGPGPLADTMVTGPHGSWRDDAARVVRSSLMSTEVSEASRCATCIALTGQPTISVDGVDLRLHTPPGGLVEANLHVRIADRSIPSCVGWSGRSKTKLIRCRALRPPLAEGSSYPTDHCSNRALLNSSFLVIIVPFSTVGLHASIVINIIHHHR